MKQYIISPEEAVEQNLWPKEALSNFHIPPFCSLKGKDASPRIWKSVQVSYQHWVNPKNPNLTDEQKQLVYDIYHQENKDILGAQYVFDQMNTV